MPGLEPSLNSDRDSNLAKTHSLPTGITHLVSGLNEAQVLFLFLKKIYLFIYLFSFIYFLAVLGLWCCMQAFSTCGEQGLLFVVVCGFLIAVASLVVEHGL